MPLLEPCKKHLFCGGFCDPGHDYCPKCEADHAHAQAQREAERKIERTLENLTRKPNRPDWRKVLGK